MVDYAKPWLPVDAQINKLIARGVVVTDRTETAKLLRTVGYYRLTGYLYPFRASEGYTDEDQRERTRILSRYREGTLIEDAVHLIDFDRQLRLLVLDGVERIEIALRTQIGHIIGRVGPFAHEDSSTFIPTFTESHIDATIGLTLSSRLDSWLLRVPERRDSSDEAFVTHFRMKYDDQCRSGHSRSYWSSDISRAYRPGCATILRARSLPLSTCRRSG